MRVSLTKTQKRVLRSLASGGTLFAAVNYPDEILRGGPELSERVKIRVAIGGRVAYCVRNKTAFPLWKADYIACAEGSSGDRDFIITAAGRAALGE